LIALRLTLQRRFILKGTYMNHQETQIRGVVVMPYHAFDADSGATMLRADPSWIDPFLGVDSYVMPQPFFPPHPHAGMSAVTLMLPEALGGFINRDSLGDKSEIRPGDLHWTQAGSGMMHEEIPSTPGNAAKGMQVFVNLARVNKMSEPKAFHIAHESMPIIKLSKGASMRLVAGSYGSEQSPIAQEPQWHTKVNMFDVTLEPNTQTQIQIPAEHNAFFVLRSGSYQLEDQVLEATEEQAMAVFYTPLQTQIKISSAHLSLRGVLFTGAPLNEPVFSKGPFTGSSAQEINHYIAQYYSGAMGKLQKSF
jgi:redox-sensitive bicupin YhaK (pirin superfamily)